MKEIQIGLIGFGTIGAGVVKLLTKNGQLIEEKLGARLVLKKVADLDITTDRGVPVAPGVLTTNVDEVLNDPDIAIAWEISEPLVSDKDRRNPALSGPARQFLPNFSGK